MLEELAKAYRESLEEAGDAYLKMLLANSELKDAKEAYRATEEKRDAARDALLDYIRLHPAPVPPGSAE